MVAWANLVGAIVQTMQDAGVGAEMIFDFLDKLDMSNVHTLDFDTMQFALHVTLRLREQVPSND